MMFKQTKRPSAVDEVLNQFVKLIKGGQLRRGDKLPSETELTHSLGVSRGPVREAMKILKYSGILEIRQGDGTYVKEDPRGSFFNPLLLELILCGNDKKNLLELRSMIEMGIITLLSLPPASEEISLLNESLGRMIKAQSLSAEKRALADIHFHSILGQLTGNELLSRFYDFILELLQPSIRETYAKKPPRDPISYHRAILEALKSGNEEDLRKSVVLSLSAWDELS
jgi:GntR family transcriptional repressor for pyruvate dehydrogenase complex